MVNRNERGKDGTLFVNNLQFPFTNGSFSIDVETASSDFNDRMEQSTASISVHSSGSIDVDGSNVRLRRQVLNSEGRPRRDIRLRFRLTEGGMRFTDVLLNTYARDLPADGKTSITIDWEADRARPL